MSGRTTIPDTARRAGVSRTTVSRVRDSKAEVDSVIKESGCVAVLPRATYAGNARARRVCSCAVLCTACVRIAFTLSASTTSR